MNLIACSRMYNVTEKAALAWSNLFAWVRQNVEVELETISHKAPARLDEFM